MKKSLIHPLLPKNTKKIPLFSRQSTLKRTLPKRNLHLNPPLQLTPQQWNRSLWSKKNVQNHRFRVTVRAVHLLRQFLFAKWAADPSALMPQNPGVGRTDALSVKNEMLALQHLIICSWAKIPRRSLSDEDDEMLQMRIADAEMHPRGTPFWVQSKPPGDKMHLLQSNVSQQPPPRTPIDLQK